MRISLLIVAIFCESIIAISKHKPPIFTKPPHSMYRVKLDSVITVDLSDKIKSIITLQYDDSGNVTSWMEINEYKKRTSTQMYKWIYDHNDNRLLEEYTILRNSRPFAGGRYRWFHDSKDRVIKHDLITNGGVKKECMYDSLGNIITEIGSRKDSVDEFIKSYKFEWMYDLDGNQLTEKTYMWSEYDNMWIERRGKECKYTPKGDTLEKIIYMLIGPSRRGLGKLEWFYDSSGNLLSGISYAKVGAGWAPKGKVEYRFDSTGNLVSMLKFGGNGIVWNTSWKMDYRYDEAGNLLTKIKYNKCNGEWQSLIKDEYRYDSIGNMHLHIYNSRRNGKWLESWKYEYKYTFDITVPLRSIAGADFLLKEFFVGATTTISKPLSKTVYKGNRIVSKMEFYYSPFSQD